MSSETTPARLRAQVGPDQWNDWRWQLRHMLTCAGDFERLFALSEGERRGLAAAPARFRVGATPYYAGLADPGRPDCPIRRQMIPAAEESGMAPGELLDPLGEDSHQPVPHLFHKYPDRCLLMVIDRCAIYCRHCNRRRLVGGSGAPVRPDLDRAIDYIASTPRIRDVLLSGGDPLLLSTSRLQSILARLRAIEHVEIIRIGTRVPVVLPMRIDEQLVRTLRAHQPLYVNTHFNHPVELTAEAARGCSLLVDGGIPLANQTVLLRGVNSSVRCLRALFRELLKIRVRPYYLFQGDPALGTDHLRTPVESAIELMDGLRGWMSGMAIPHLVIDAPGGGGKIPIGPAYLRELGEREVLLRDYRGREVRYPQAANRDISVSYDQVYFAGRPEDDDREGGRP